MTMTPPVCIPPLGVSEVEAQSTFERLKKMQRMVDSALSLSVTHQKRRRNSTIGFMRFCLKRRRKQSGRGRSPSFEILFVTRPKVKPIDAFLDDARSRLIRVVAEDLDDEIADGAVLVDIRPVEQRQRDGDLPGAIVIDRNVLEWRLAPTSAAREIDVQDGRRVIIVCNEGYQSSLVAATLQELGVPGATDLVGGYQAYLMACSRA